MTSSASTKASDELAPHVKKVGELLHLDLIITGARCGGCLAKIESGLGEIPSVRQARMNLSSSRLHVAWEGAASQANLVSAKLEALGFSSAPLKAGDTSEVVQRAESRGLLICMAVAAFGLMNVMILSIAVWSGAADMSAAERNLFHMVSAAIALPVVAYSGSPFFKSAWRALRAKQSNMDLPISLAILLACGLSVAETILRNEHVFFDAALMLIFLLLIGRFLDARLRAKTGRAANDLAALKQINARRIDEQGRVTDIPVVAVRAGDRLLVPAGGLIAADGRIVKGASMLDAAIVTGEPVPQNIGPGDVVFSGCLNLTQPITIEVLREADNSFLSEISSLVEAGQQSQIRYVQLADRAARAYVPIVHSLALLTFLGWLLMGGSPRTATLNAIAVLIITCPCALGLAVPAVQVVAVGKLFAAGIVVKTGHALERLAEITDVVFDKTGTLTRASKVGEFSLITSGDLALFSSLAQQSYHPATAHLREMKGQHSVDNIIESVGEGVSGHVNGVEVRLGRKAFISDAMPNACSGLWGSIAGQAPIELTAGEIIRREALSTLHKLENMGLGLSLVSGDSIERVQRVSQNLGIQNANALTRPGGKSEIIKARQNEGEKILMVGDGINDAPALAHAHASATLASATDISRATADIVLRRDSLAGLPYAIQMARAARAAVLQNFAFAAIYNLLAVPLAVAGLVTPLVAAGAMSLSSILVTLNALRLNSINSEPLK